MKRKSGKGMRSFVELTSASWTKKKECSMWNSTNRLELDAQALLGCAIQAFRGEPL